ncbi:hypothetical protein CROQUDRAFT_92150 [Cronartium quercuum f. sp. fusiforme G11]|uniref:Uncharacterized protein n=1 Tax=Cronartium quercuum f. sp. fusiforme G11 TaxID=708437 RepID=A0A9P6TCK1_9BASI|nr:hypothetical protein CROQUDRAFT_92150 [Cronartium quercuum f. sp. fusiforme G11]
MVKNSAYLGSLRAQGKPMSEPVSLAADVRNLTRPTLEKFPGNESSRLSSGDHQGEDHVFVGIHFSSTRSHPSKESTIPFADFEELVPEPVPRFLNQFLHYGKVSLGRDIF